MKVLRYRNQYLNSYGVEVDEDVAEFHILGFRIKHVRDRKTFGVHWTYALAYRGKHLWNMSWWGR